MAPWIWIVITAHFFNAINFVIDKFLLSKAVRESFVYTFAIGMLGLAVMILIPFGFEFPGWFLLGINLVTGIFFIAALTFFFRSLQMNEASRIVPIIGSAIPLGTFILSFFFLDERLDTFEIAAFVLLLAGTYVITKDFDSKRRKREMTIHGLGIALLSALCFSASFVLNKYVFETQPFFSGFIWIRIGSFLAVMVLLFSHNNRRAILLTWRQTKTRLKGLFLANQIIGAGAFLLLSWSIALASVTLVNALQGVQYVILLLMAVIVSLKYPKIFSENVSFRALVPKFFGVMLIGSGLFIISWYAA